LGREIRIKMSSGKKRERRRPDVKHAAAHNLVMGRRALGEILRHCPRQIEAVFAAGSAEHSKSCDKLVSEAGRCGISWNWTAAEELSLLAGSDSHQGLVAVLKDRASLTLKDLMREESGRTASLLLMADSVFDPQNLGALVRAAECFGAAAVLWSRNRGCGMSPVVRKAAVGATELLNCIQVNNLVESLKKIKEHGYWAVAADAGSDALPLEGFEFPKKVVVVVGSEGKGISRLALEVCDFRVKIGMSGKIESLNVSQATAIILYAYMSQIRAVPILQ
jgi:23S rRNA (guanosine2251-2'-O)-methyltransferase